MGWLDDSGKGMGRTHINFGRQAAQLELRRLDRRTASLGNWQRFFAHVPIGADAASLVSVPNPAIAHVVITNVAGALVVVALIAVAVVIITNVCTTVVASSNVGRKATSFALLVSCELAPYRPRRGSRDGSACLREVGKVGSRRRMEEQQRYGEHGRSVMRRELRTVALHRACAVRQRALD